MNFLILQFAINIFHFEMNILASESLWLKITTEKLR